MKEKSDSLRKPLRMVDADKPRLVIGESIRRSGATTNFSIYTKCFAKPTIPDAVPDEP
jgi:hypothetical protein